MAVTPLPFAQAGHSFFDLDFNIRALIALALVSVICGAVGSLVVGSRMAFFSDALAHCAFAGVSIGFGLFLFCRVFLWPGLNAEKHFWEWVTPVMLAFGALVGCGIAYLRSRTGLANDTVIGVFFAGAIGLAAMLKKLFRDRALFNMEDFLFGGSPINVTPDELVVLAVLAVLTAVTMAYLYNHLLLDNFNSSLARSRRVPVDLSRYLFIILLALIVNLCLRLLGALLVNALLIVPAAAAVNVSRNMRQFFWLTVALCLLVSLTGLWLQWEALAVKIELGMSGTIVMMSVLLFLLSLVAGPLVRGRARP